MDQVSGIGDIVGIGSKRTKEGRHVEIKLAAMLSPTIAAQLMSLQDNGKVRFAFEPVVEQQVLPGMDKPQDVPGQLKAVFGRHSTCPECQSEMDELAGMRCPKCGGEIRRANSTAGDILQCAECRHWMTEGEYRARTRRRRWRDPATGKVYEVSQGIGDGWGIFERKGRSSHRVRGVEYQHDRRAVERAAAEYAARHGWVETTDEEAGHEPEPFRPASGE
ncbi:MAG TPA: hypothetical protein GXX28_02140 [Firmicutes bacterium]|nr:hypothetical protein [Bacillota bacterium]